MTSGSTADPVFARGRETGTLHKAAWLEGPPAPVAVWQEVDAVKTWLHVALQAAAKAEPATAAAAEWLLDNAFQVQRAAIQIKQDLPRGFYRRLRPLAERSGGHEPLVLAIAHDLIHATNFQLSREGVLSYLQGYQQDNPLDIAELWALPVMLRLACLERLLSGFASLFPAVPSPIEASEACRRYLQEADATENVSRGIANLGVISSIAWKDVFDAASMVERTLAQDPCGIYATTDFETRDAYRRAVERLAVRSDHNEVGVAEAALTMARGHSSAPFSHVGYWLVGEGLPELEDRIGARVPRRERIGRQLLRYPGAAYSLALFMLGLAGLAVPALYLAWNHASLLQWLAGIALSALPATVISVTVVNWLVTLTVPPAQLFKLDFTKAIDPGWSTVVAVPVILRDAEEVPALVRRLESHYLSNSAATAFVLLSDPCDAAEEHLAADAAVEAALKAGIEALNRRYGSIPAEGPFSLLHRGRRYNPAQGCWMAWERKRGKLEQFNDFLLSGNAEAFPVTAGPISHLPGARFVVTADLDTRLPPGTVARLAATLAHPLNRPVADGNGRIVSGYTVLQPRVEIAPHGSDTLFARLFGGDTAIDIYSRAVSDVYQDLVGTGSYVGKGIYDVAAFSRSLEGRVPENNLLSHDLWEGLHGRAGLVSDVIVYESFPSNYLEYTRRWHRWVRGDWQLLPWLFPRVPGAEGRRLRNRLSVFGRLRLWDTMRRSLVPPSVLLLLLAGWLVLPGEPIVWTLLAIAAPAAYLFTDLVTGVARGRRRGVLTGTFHRAGEHAGRWALAIAFLLSDSAVALHAIGTTLLRLRRGRRLLEWTSAAHVSRQLEERDARFAHWLEMWMSPSAAIALGIGLALFGSTPALVAAAPLLCLWLVAPEVAWWTGRQRTADEETLDDEARAFLRLTARRSWLYFEEYVGPEDHWLPPDNHQEEPVEQTALRTSPTNIGMMLLSGLAAWRLGYIGLPELCARVRETLATVDRLERWNGHVLNWYDTRTLKPLEPRYVSTVDSGNLAVSLVTLARACDDIAGQPLFGHARWQGLDDSLALLEESLRGARLRRSADLLGMLDRLRAAIRADMAKAEDWPALLRHCESSFAEARQRLAVLVDSAAPPGNLRDLRTWLERSEHHLAAIHRDLDATLPWLARLGAAPRECTDLARSFAFVLDCERPVGQCAQILREAAALGQRHEDGLSDEAKVWLAALSSDIRRGLAGWRRVERDLARTAARAEALADGMDFRPLYDRNERLFHIGYDLSADRIDTHHYDLLASEARLASFFAVAKQDVPLEHWFQLGRPIAKHRHELALVSWNGSMFEYLMPALFLRSDRSTLLGESDRSAVAIQRRYAGAKGVPWGISESGFAATGPDGTWRYRAFGVPELGLRRGLAEDLVIAPYASALALSACPVEAAANLRHLAAIGGLGRCGLYEALDFTPGRRLEGQAFAPVNSYMAHHQGMSIAAIANALHDDLFVAWFHADAKVQTVELLLNERIPWELPPEIERIETGTAASPEAAGVPRPHPWQPLATAGTAALHVLGNGRMATRIAIDGSGDLSWKTLAVTRPGTAPGNGQLLYLRDLESGETWSPTAAPSPGEAERQILFHAHKAEFRCRAHGISTTLDILVAPAEDVEIRRVRLVNATSRKRTIEVASHAEIALAPASDWLRHPAFARLFVSAEAEPSLDALVFHRRPRDPDDSAAVLVQRLIGTGARLTGLCTARTLTRRRYGDAWDFPTIPAGSDAVPTYPLDPASALRAEVTLGPHGEAEFAVISTVAANREAALDLAHRYGSIGSIDWVEQDAAARAARDIHGLGMPVARLGDAQLLFTALHGAAGPRAVGDARASRDDLWALGLSGDLPILLAEIDEDFDVGEIRFLLAAHRLWRWRGAAVDLVLLHTGVAGYIDPVRERVIDTMRAAGSQDLLGERGGVHLYGRDQLDPVRVSALRAAAAVMLSPGADIAGQVERQHLPLMAGAPFTGSRAPVDALVDTPAVANLRFANGYGGFTERGDYRIAIPEGGATPAPWANVIANDDFGAIVTEAGLGWSFAGNSGENRLTPWHNDPLIDPQGEALYLRDEETSEVWSITPQPAGLAGHCEIEHRPGGSAWTRRDRGLIQELDCRLADAASAKIVRIRLTDSLGRSRRVTATFFADWLLGAVAGEPAPFRRSWYRPDVHAMLASNGWHGDFAGRTAFLFATLPPHSLTTSRLEFLGREMNWRRPAGLANWDLGERVENQGADAVAALQVHVDIPADGTVDFAFVLGQAEHEAAAVALITQLRQQAQGTAETARDDDRAGITVATPDPAFDLMVNRWLPAQTVEARLFARAGFYQASGAYGFRDQLQDVLALLLDNPQLARRQILRAAAHQFEAGDVLHWWHPPSGRGVRTRCSDDLLWLPYAVARYVEATGDAALLDERVAFLQAAELAAAEHDRYAEFAIGESASLYEHCLRAFDRAWRLGARGLPLIGDGDWNDGMNRVGSGGKGESVWLAWFMIATIRSFSATAVKTGRPDFPALWRARADRLVEAVERVAWDGAWYVRAFDDLGRAWGSHRSEECRIDSLAQSWAVIAGGDPQRAGQALDAAFIALVRPDDDIVRLLDPPFADTPRDPGYIKAYPPGIRENGGQYSHAATWLGIACALRGDGDRAKLVFDRLNPILHSDRREKADIYRIEPYAVAGDIGGTAPHLGRGGWSWYTGAAAWSWRLAVEYILGIRLVDGKIVLSPCLPGSWPGFRATVRGHGSIEIAVERAAQPGLSVDDHEVPDGPIEFPGEGRHRRVKFLIPSPDIADKPQTMVGTQQY